MISPAEAEKLLEVRAAEPSLLSLSAPASCTPVPKTPSLSGMVTPGPRSPVCPPVGSYLTAIRVGKQVGYDRAAFQFSGRAPTYVVDRVGTVYADPRGNPVALAGQSFVRVVFRGASAVCPQSLGKTCTGPATLTPFYAELLVISAAGDFEGYPSIAPRNSDRPIPRCSPAWSCRSAGREPQHPLTAHRGGARAPGPWPSASAGRRPAGSRSTRTTVRRWPR
jgi:hypothetical protein